MKEKTISVKTFKLAENKGFKFKTKKIKIGEKESNLGKLFNSPIYKKIKIKPTQSLVQKQLREQYNIELIVRPTDEKIERKWIFQGYSVAIYRYSNSGQQIYCNIFPLVDGFNNENYYEVYEKALEKGLQEGIKLI